ncbi:MAG: ATP-binding cassette domain-containing protein, partial [Lachnospiraceae bacterium]|nr:ATP-binding cassette domain-containing protein [Lachnospiraceae bacterium]
MDRASFSYGKRYDETQAVFRDLSLSVSSGEILAVLGPNGSGKTTLLKCMLNLLKLQ